MHPKVIPSDILTAAWTLHAPACCCLLLLLATALPHQAALPGSGLLSVVVPYCNLFVALGAAVAWAATKQRNPEPSHGAICYRHLPIAVISIPH
jgi:hypothetical protein